MINARRKFSTGLAILLSTAGIQAKEPPSIAHNPFSRPPSTLIPDTRQQVLADGSIQPLDLRATMVSANASLANVAGRILRPGDKAQGYVLLKVFEDRAIFVREGQQLTVYVKPLPVEDNE
jgi:hypothetical protein